MGSTTNFASAWQEHAMNIYERETTALPGTSEVTSDPRENQVKTEVLPPHHTGLCGTKKRGGSTRLNKFVRRLHDMLQERRLAASVEGKSSYPGLS